jgi:hypothetical protein
VNSFLENKGKGKAASGKGKGKMPAKTTVAGKPNTMNKGKGKAESSKVKGKMPEVRHQSFSKALRPATATMKGKKSHGGQQV